MGANGGDTVHVAFGEAAAGGISEALELVGRHERVLGLPDDLSFGPIDPPNLDLRRTWAKSVLHHDYDQYQWLRGAAETFWTDATADQASPVVWVCRTYAAEQAGFLEFIWRMGGRGFDIVDATDVEVPSRHDPNRSLRPWALGLLTGEQIVSAGLIDQRAAFPQGEAQSARARWSELRRENAPFRVIRDGRLVSAPLSYFDEFLLKYASSDWQKATRLVGETMGRMVDLEPPGQSPGDHVLFGRMVALGKAGLLQVEGSGPQMRDYRVRKMRETPSDVRRDLTGP